MNAFISFADTPRRDRSPDLEGAFHGNLAIPEGLIGKIFDCSVSLGV
jgi:hypothetical protein